MKPIRSAPNRVLWAWMMTNPIKILPFIAKICCNPWLPPLICSSGCTDHQGTSNYNSEKSVGRLQTCRDMDRKVFRVYTMRFFNGFIRKSDVKVEFVLWAKTSGVFGGSQLRQNCSIMSLVTRTSVWEGDTALCMNKLVLMQKIPGVSHFCSPWSSHSTCSTSSAFTRQSEAT